MSRAGRTAAALLPVAALLGLLALLPHASYLWVLSRGADSGLLRVGRLPPSLLNPAPPAAPPTAPAEDPGGGGGRWRTIHFKTFLLPVPTGHPDYVFMPDPALSVDGEPRMRIRIQNPYGETLASLRMDDPVPFSPPRDKGRLLSPDRLGDRVRGPGWRERLWRDVFERELDPVRRRGPWRGALALARLSYGDLLRNLLVLAAREDLLPEGAESVAWLGRDGAGNGAGVAVLPPGEGGAGGGAAREAALLLKDGMVHRLLLAHDPSRQRGRDYRDRLLGEVAVGEGGERAAVDMYARYKALPLRRRVGDEGVAHFYAAWSHDPGNPGYLREILDVLGDRGSPYAEVFRNHALRARGPGFLGGDGAADGGGRAEAPATAGPAPAEPAPADALETAEDRIRFMLDNVKPDGDRPGVMTVE